MLERVSEETQRYALKNEALRRHLASDEERSVAHLGLLLLADSTSVSAHPLCQTACSRPRQLHAFCVPIRKSR